MPKILFPLADAVVAGLNMLLAMVAMFLLLQVLHPAVHVQLVLVPVGIFLLGCFTFGLTLVMMTLVTYFRDFEHITQVFLQAFYFACPILYMPGHIGKYAWLIEANPMTHVLAFFQAAFYYGEWPDSRTWLLAVLAATVSLGFGGVIYKRYEHDYIHRL
jgi:ABC-type polysaccharide/polyol phosphate export permease